MLDRLPWHALHTEHARFSVSAPLACKYRADVAPFAATVDNTPESMLQLKDLMAPGELVWLLGDQPPDVPGLICEEALLCPQMIARDPAARSRDEWIRCLGGADAAAMVELTSVAFPGFFRKRTCEMGAYYGIHSGGELIAMAGERMAVPGYREISAVCTRPGHTGNGYAARLVTHLMNEHADAGVQSFLHVASTNARAIELYLRLGFTIRREILAFPVSRRECAGPEERA